MQLSVSSFLKKSLVLSLASVFLMNSNGLNAFASVDTAQIEKAQDLGNLGFIKGVNGNYNLSGTLKRSEALVLIAAFSGDQAKVNQAKSRVDSLKYRDVKPTDWFAPYVVYGIENQIASGTGKDRFSPNDPVTHRQFLKMLLSTLKYETDKDFTWLSVDEYAKQIGLSTLEGQDGLFDQKLLRSDAFSYFYNGLLKPQKGGSEATIEYLVRSGMVEQSRLDSSKLGQDFLKSPFAATPKKDAAAVPVSFTATATDHGTVTLAFSQAMNPASAQNPNNYTVALVDKPQVIIPVLSAAYDSSSNSVALKLSADGSNTVFDVRTSNLLTKERNIALVSENNNRFMGSNSLKFTSPNGNRITVEMSGLSTKGINLSTISLNPVDSSGAKPTLVQIINQTDSQFTLVTKGMSSNCVYQLQFAELYDTKQQLTNTNFSTYIKSSNTEPPKILGIATSPDDLSHVYFDKPLDIGTVTNLNNVSLVSEFGKSVSITAITARNEKEYQIKHGPLGSFIRYTLAFKQMVDQDGIEVGTLSKAVNGYKFSDLSVVSSQFTSPTEFVFQLSEAIDATSIKNTSNYRIYDLEDRKYTPSEIRYTPGSTEVRLIFAAPIHSAFNVTFIITDLKDAKDFPTNQLTLNAPTVK